MRQKDMIKRYFRELGGSLAIYMALLVMAVKYAPAVQSGALRAAVAASPMIGFVLMLWAIARQINQSDEFVRMRHLENMAIAGGITAGLSFTYGFMETVGFPQLSMFAVWMTLCGVWGVVNCLRKLFDR